MGWTAALASWASSVVAAAAAWGLGLGSTAGCMAMALAAASYPSGHQPCLAPKLHTEVADYYLGLGAWWGAKGYPLGPPQSSRPGRPAP